MAEQYNWVDNCCESGKAICNTDILNENLMHLKYSNNFSNKADVFSKGNLITDSEMLEQVKAMKHSTFDRSKFTVVGSPTITDDGIASGFSSSSSYLKSNYAMSSGVHPFDFYGSFTTGSTIPANISPMSFATNASGFLLQTISNGIKIYNNVSGSFSTEWASTSLQTNTKYYFRIKQDNTNCIFYLGTSKNDMRLIGTTTRLAEFTTLSPNEVFIGTRGGNYAQYWQGSIDLKQFSITVDGIEVFNGNKTGIDQIKKDNYTVTGSPVITNDGVISGFSESNYIKHSLDIQTDDTLIIEGKVIYKQASYDEHIFRIYGNNVEGTTMMIGLAFNQNKRLSSSIRTYSSSSTQYLNGISINNVNINDGDIFEFKLITTKTNQTLKYSINGVAKSDVSTNITLLAFKFNALTIGSAGASLPWAGSIDLNSFKIYVDGSLVYQPTLRIPYTQSNTGAKIVDSIYRDRVQDMYEQFGSAPYYTLSEIDFTLPMGELYGMLNNLEIKKQDKCIHIIDTYVNEASGYRIWSDGYCEQWGTTNKAKSGTISFMKTFKDNNYNFILFEIGATSSWSQTGYHVTLYEDRATWSRTDSCVSTWRASGYLAEGEY